MITTTDPIDVVLWVERVVNGTRNQIPTLTPGRFAAQVDVLSVKFLRSGVLKSPGLAVTQVLSTIFPIQLP